MGRRERGRRFWLESWIARRTHTVNCESEDEGSFVPFPPEKRVGANSAPHVHLARDQANGKRPPADGGGAKIRKKIAEAPKGRACQ